MLTHFRNSPSCVKIFRELAAQGKLEVPRERRLLDAYGKTGKDDQKAGKEKRRRQGQDGRAENKERTGKGGERGSAGQGAAGSISGPPPLLEATQATFHVGEEEQKLMDIAETQAGNVAKSVVE